VFSGWRRYRSAFSEAIGLPAMSEHLSGVTMYGAPGRLLGTRRGDGQAVISGQDLEFHIALRVANRPPLFVRRRADTHPHT
jgi:hypothetical protein